MANGKRLDAITKRLFRHGIEGSGIRNRSYALSYLVNLWAIGRNAPVHWLSIGCGSGQPTFDAAQRLPERVKKNTSLTLVDRDDIVLDFAKSLYERQASELPRAVFSNEDAFNPKFLQKLNEDRGVDVIDILGMFEYLDDQTSIQFLRELYGALNSGGILIFSNMDVHRPDYDINQRVIGWPSLILRSPKEIMSLIVTSGIPLDETRFIQTQDNINNIFEVVKK
jgi:SAM-dependent methyltransferase